MTYGATGGMLREQLTTLLRQHRIQQRLGGPGLWTVPETTTLQERRVLGQQIARYRHGILVWCLQAVTAATPPARLATTMPRDPVAELRRQLARVVETSPARLPPLDELTTPQPFAIVETWRHGARAAALGEHDFTTDVGYGQFDHRQCMTVINDAAEITQALVVLDKRYDNIPGWTSLKEPGHLNEAALGSVAGYDDFDLTVDQRGWHPSSAIIDGPPLPGVGGVLQAVHNTRVHLSAFPNAHNLRLVLDSQRVLSRDTALRIRRIDPALATMWVERAQTYTTLIHQTRDLRGLIGHGGPAAAEGANSISRLRPLHTNHLADAHALQHLNRLFNHIDTRISDIIEQGAKERLYFVRVQLPRVDRTPGKLVSPPQTRYVPTGTALQHELRTAVRTQLRLCAESIPLPVDAPRSRDELHDALTHKPDWSRRVLASQTSPHPRAVGI